MPVKDLYYQKYLKYKNKYLNLCNQLGGGGFSITTTTTTTKDDTIIIDYTEKTSDFLVEKLNNPNIHTIKLEKVMDYYFNIKSELPQVPSFPNIKTLIFDTNNLSDDSDIISIVNLIRLFTNVTTLSFNNCNLTDESGKTLQKKLLELPQKISTIHFDNNPYLSKTTKMLFIENFNRNMDTVTVPKREVLMDSDGHSAYEI